MEINQIVYSQKNYYLERFNEMLWLNRIQSNLIELERKWVKDGYNTESFYIYFRILLAYEFLEVQDFYNGKYYKISGKYDDVLKIISYDDYVELYNDFLKSTGG